MAVISDATRLIGFPLRQTNGGQVTREWHKGIKKAGVKSGFFSCSIIHYPLPVVVILFSLSWVGVFVGSLILLFAAAFAIADDWPYKAGELIVCFARNCRGCNCSELRKKRQKPIIPFTNVSEYSTYEVFPRNRKY